MMHISTHQALMIWHELELCYQGENSFGGDTAEIYAYRVRPDFPGRQLTIDMINRGDDDPILKDDLMEDIRHTVDSLADLCLLFEETRKCQVTFDFSRPGMSVEEWREDAKTWGNMFVHRTHVTVIPGSAEQSDLGDSVDERRD